MSSQEIAESLVMQLIRRQDQFEAYVRDTLQQTLAEISTHVAIFQGAQAAGIVNIFETRHEAMPAIVRHLEDLVERGERATVCLAGVALKDFFNPSFSSFRQIDHWIGQSELGIRALLLDPDGEQARERTRIEGEAYSTIPDIRISLNYLRWQRQQSKPVDFRLYDIYPAAYFVITEEFLFIEQYHSGKVVDTVGCLAGYVPMMQVKKESALFNCMKAHFDYLYRRARELDADPETNRNPRAMEVEWIRTHQEELTTFVGQWVAIEGQRGVIASGADLEEVFGKARVQGVEIPFIIRVSSKDEGALIGCLQ